MHSVFVEEMLLQFFWLIVTRFLTVGATESCLALVVLVEMLLNLLEIDKAQTLAAVYFV